jgi:hypothetical protein
MSLETIAPPAVAPDPPTAAQQGMATPISAVRTIPVSGGPNALCDEEDFPLLSLFTWNVNKAAHLSYPTTRLGGRIFYLHHLVMLQPHKAKIYHYDGNLFNNCRANLCVASKAQINASANKQKRPCSSIYKGVSWSKQKAKWQAYHHSPSRTKTDLGYFLSEEAAARAYDQAAYATYGDFARLNFPRPKLDHDRPLSKITEQTRLNWSLTADGAAIIPTTNGPGVLCDPEELPFLSRLTWRAESVGDLQFAVAPIHGRDIFMHHWILRCTDKRRFVHQDGNGLNNRRCNLLAASCPQIYSGKRKSVGATSRFKGVCRTRANRWAAKIIASGISTWIGTFDHEEDAARAYDAAARAAFGPFAYQNFPDHPSERSNT